VLPGDIGTGVGSGYTDDVGNFLNPGDLTTPHEILNTGFFDGAVIETAPLAGIEAVVRLLDLQSATATIDHRSGAGAIQAVTRFDRGHHSSGYLEVFNGFGSVGVSTEWRNQQTQFMVSSGLLLPVNTSPDASVLLTDPNDTEP
jgi:glutamine synthetase type III